MSVAQQAARGILWNLVFGVGARFVQLAGTLILTHLIAPDAYGTVTTASILVVTAGIFTSFAFGQYLIAKRSPPEVAIQALVAHTGIGVLAMAVLFSLRHPISELVGVPGAAHYVLGFAISHVLDRSRYVPERLLLRALRFRAVASISATGELAYVVTALAAARSLGPDAIVAGWLARSGLTWILFMRTAPRPEWLARPRLELRELGNLFGYGLPIMIGAISDHIATRFDNLIMSKLFDPGVMARYSLSYSLAEMPVNSIASQIGDVLMPSFSKMEEEPRRKAVVGAATMMSLVISPIGVGLAAVASPVAEAFFDEKWAPMMGPMLAILSLMSVFRPMTWSAIAYLQSIQRTRLIMYSSFFRAIVVLALVASGGVLGDVYWACAGAGLGFVLHTVVTIIAAGRVGEFSGPAYLAGVLRPLLPCAPMYFAVIGVAQLFAAASVPLGISLAAQVVTGAIVYVAATFVLLRGDVAEIRRHAREVLSARRRRRGAGA